MHPDLLDFLVDPNSGSQLTLDPQSVTVDGTITTGWLLSGDGTRYEIREGVAILDEALDVADRYYTGA